MHSGHDGALADRGTAVEVLLTRRRYPRFALLLIAMLAELTLAPFAIMIARLVGLHATRTGGGGDHHRTPA